METLSSDETPPVAHYQLGTDDQGFYTEFLTPLTGSGVRRDGTADTTVARAGIIAQKLRHLEVLLVAPWRCPVGGGEGSVLDTAVEVAVANPVSFVAQRLLIHASRAPAKRAQDILYLHDTVQLFGASLEPFNAIWRTDVSPSLSRTRRALKLEAEVELEHGLGWHGIRARWATERTHGDLKAATAAGGRHDMGTYLGYVHRDQAEHRAVVALPRVQVARFMVTPEEPTVRRARRAGTPRVARQRFSTRYPMVTQHRWAHPAPLVPTRPPSSACIGTRREQSGPNKTPAAT